MPAPPPSGSGPYRLIDQLAEEFAGRYRAGQRPSLSEYVDRHPELADEIRELFPALARLEQAEENLHRDPPQDVIRPPLRRLGDFRIVREMGRGGMGIVYEAEQVSLGRRVAVKVLPLSAAHDGRAVERFRREARAAARMHHTNIVPVFEVGHEVDTCFYVMQFIRGQGLDVVIDELRRLRAQDGSRTADGAPASPPDEAPEASSSRTEAVRRTAMSLLTGRFATAGLDTTLEIGSLNTPAPSANPGPDGPGGNGPPGSSRPLHDATGTEGPTGSVVLPGGSQLSAVESGDRSYFRSVAHIGRQVAQALAYAHARGIIHRDVKPSNLLLDTEGVVWVTDFGLAKAEEDGLTRTGDLVGTLRYMAPERFRGGGDARADIYALGLTLYELLTLRPAFDASDRLRLIERIQADEPPRPRAQDPRIPRDLETIVVKASDKDPRRRYATADELAEDLRRFLDGEPIRARRVSETERAWKWARRRPALSTALALLAISMVVGTAASVNFAIRANVLAERARVRALAERAARGDAERHLYVSQTARAQLEWRANNVREAERILDRCPPALRGWEWHFLLRLCHAEMLDLGGHSHWVQRVAFSPDGQVLASAGGGNPYVPVTGPTPGEPVRPGEAILWDATTGDRLHTLVHPDVVDDLAFRPDGRTLLTGCRDGKGRLWDVATGQPLGPPLEVPGQALALALAPDGRTVALGMADGTIELFDLVERRARRALPRRNATHIISFLTFSPDGRFLAAVSIGPASVYGPLDVWDLEAEAVRVRPAEAQWCRGAAFSPDGRLLAGASHGAIRLWDPATGRLVQTIAAPADGAWDVAFSPDGQVLAGALTDATVRLWGVTHGDELPGGVHRGHDGRVQAVAFSPDGHRLVSGGIDGQVKVWDRHEDLEVGLIADPLPIGETEAIAFNDEGLLVHAGRHGAINVLQPESGLLLDHRVLRLSAAWIVPGEPVTLDATGRWLAGVSQAEPRLIRCWDARTGRERSVLQGHIRPVDLVAVSPGGRWVASCGRPRDPRAAARRGPEVLIWDGDGGPSRRLDLGPGVIVRRLAFSPDGTRLAWSGARVPPGGEAPEEGGQVEGLLGIVEAATGREVRRFTGIATSGEALAFSPDGLQIAAAGDANLEVRILDLATGREVASHQGPPGARDLAFSPDGRRLAVASLRLVTLLDSATGEALLNLRSRAQIISRTNSFNARVRFSPDGRYLAAVTFDGLNAVAIWSAVTPPAAQRRAQAERRTVTSLLLQGDLRGLDAIPPATPWEFLRSAVEHFKAAQLDRAEADLDRALALRPDCADAEPRLHDLCASLGRWTLAAAACDLRAWQRPGAAPSWRRLAVARLMAGDRDGYRRACAEAIARFAHTDNPGTWQVVLACALAPDAVADPAVPVRLAEADVARTPRPVPKQLALGLALYRDGQADRAIRYLEASQNATAPAPLRALAWPALALAHHRLGHDAEARRWLERARSLAPGADGSRPGDILGAGSSWWEGAEFLLLRREAEAALAYEAGWPRDPFARDATTAELRAGGPVDGGAIPEPDPESRR